jgi:predicted RNA-binding Zn-ribbon protein involved in translation (DUF1610 family)
MTPKLKETSMVCPNCGEKILRLEEEGLILRNKVLVLRESGTFAKCKHCGRKVKVPLKLTA